MRKLLSVCLVAILCMVLAAGCAQSSDSSSASAEASADASGSASPETTEDTDEASEASAAAAVSASADTEAQSLAWFFEEWPKRLEELNATDMTEQLEVSDALSTMVGEARNWRSHQSGDTVTIELPSDSVVVKAQGSDTSLQNASIECTVGALQEGVSPSLILFTVGAGALAEVLSGESEGGLETVNDAVAALMSGTSDDGVLTAKPVTFGNASFEISLDPETRALTFTGTPA